MRPPRGLSFIAWIGIIAVLPAIIFGIQVFAHQDDPKALNPQPPYTGPGYRSAGPGSGSGSGSVPFGPPGGYDALGVTMLSWLTVAELGGTGLVNDCWGYTAPSGREYALMGHSTGTSIVEITVPGNPVVIDNIPGPGSCTWRDVKTYLNYAYIVSECGGGIQVLDLADIDNGNVAQLPSVLTGGVESSHNVAIDEVSGFLYRCGGSSNGLRIYDLANPTAPLFVGSWNVRYVHDVQVVTYTTGPYAGTQVAFACGGANGGGTLTGLDILDVTNKSNIVSFSQLIYPNGQYSHQGWLSDDRQYFYLNDELDEGNLGIPTTTFVFDVNNLAAPVLVNDFTNGVAAIGHNLYVKDDLILEANYRSGLRVFDATDPVNPVETGYFDTYPADDTANFDGLWSLFPYFPSGVVIGSDRQRGLFVWEIGDPALTFAYPNGIPTEVLPTGGTFEVEITPGAGVVLDPASPTLWVDNAGGFLAHPLVSLGGTLYEATIPISPCGATLSWYVAANPLGGAVVTDPGSAPAATYPLPVGSIELSVDSMESDLGWTVGAAGDAATTGIWTRVNPVGTAAQPEDDHTATGTNCWVTGQGLVGGAVGANDVDGGATTLMSPVYDLTGMVDPEFVYWRWYSNDAGSAPGEDVFRVEISGDNGANWLVAEVVGPTGAGTSGGWNSHRVLVSDFVTPSATVRLRFIAEDLGAGSIVEAGIDDLAVEDTVCVDCNGNGIDDSVDVLTGTSPDVDMDGIPDECTAPPCPIPFIRGDINGDGSIDISDPVGILEYLFAMGATPVPLESADIDADGQVNIGDPVNLLAYLFTNGPPPPAPFPNPGCP